MTHTYAYIPRGGDFYENGFDIDAIVMRGPVAQVARCHAAIRSAMEPGEVAAGNVVYTLLIAGDMWEHNDADHDSLDCALLDELSTYKDVTFTVQRRPHDADRSDNLEEDTLAEIRAALADTECVVVPYSIVSTGGLAYSMQ